MRSAKDWLQLQPAVRDEGPPEAEHDAHDDGRDLITYGALRANPFWDPLRGDPADPDGKL